MQTDRSRQFYIARLNKVLDAIRANLDQPLTLDMLAGVAGFSPFHFHRIFKTLVGETLGEYIQRARLEKAANWLAARPDQTVLEIAIGCGFTSAAIFSRAFRSRFGASPSQFRRKYSNPGKVERNGGKDSPELPVYNVGSDSPIFERRQLPMDVQVKTLPAFHVAYVRHIYGYSKGVRNPQIGEAFQKVTRWAGARDLMGPDTLVIGIPYDNPEITPNDKCRYDACVTVPESVKAEDGEIGIQDIAGGKYAICRIEVSPLEAHKIAEMVDHLYGDWLPDSGYQADDKPPLEIYYPTPDKPAGTWISMAYCLPLEPL